ncbi:uncharacterized protein METZ01_LOCUS398787, partial [marine metagenome]
VSESKKILYYALGLSAISHIIIIGFLPMWMAIVLSGLLIVVLVGVLWKQTTGRRAALFTGLGVAICIEAIAWAV